MVCSAVKRQKIYDDIGDALLVLLTTASSAETEIFQGSPNAPALFKIVTAAASGISQLAPAYEVLEYAKTRGPGPYPQDDLREALPYDPAIINRTLDRLAESGILNSRTEKE